MRITRTPAARNQGFTLIELMIVIVIISIMLGMSVLAMRSDGFNTLQNDGNQLVKQIELAKQELAMRQIAITLQLNRTGWSFVTPTANGLQPTPITLLRTRNWSQKVDSITSPLHNVEDEKILIELDGEPIGSPIDVTIISGNHILNIKNDAQGRLAASKAN